MSSALLAAAVLSACTTEIITEVPGPGSGGNNGGSGQNPAPVTVQRIELSGASWMLEQGSASYSATVFGSNGSVLTDRSVAWTSSDTAVATIVGSGVVYAKRPGEVTLTVVADNKYAVMHVAIRPRIVDTIIVRLSGGAVYAGETSWAGAELRAADGRLLERRVSWTSLDPSIATVDSEGRIRGLRPGTVDIVGTSDGRSAALRIAVQPSRAAGIWRLTIDNLHSARSTCTATIVIELLQNGEQVTGGRRADMWTGESGMTCTPRPGATGTDSVPVLPSGHFTGTIQENGYVTLRAGNGWQFTGMLSREARTWTGSAIYVDGEPVNGIVPVRTGSFTAAKP